MAVGPKARDPNTPYMVYEFSVNGRVYYTGIGQADSARATDRWNYVSKQIERLKREGSLPPGKMRDLLKPSGAMIRAMIERGMKPHDIAYPWRCLGRAEALLQEARRIEFLLGQGCILANVAGNSRRVSVEQILQYLGVE